jgi:hypothetical protein
MSTIKLRIFGKQKALAPKNKYKLSYDTSMYQLNLDTI